MVSVSLGRGNRALGKPRCLDQHCWVRPSWSSQGVQEETVLHTQANTCQKNAYGFSGTAGELTGNSASTFELPVAQMTEVQFGNGWHGMLWLACTAMWGVLGPSGAQTCATDTRAHLWG